MDNDLLNVATENNHYSVEGIDTSSSVLLNINNLVKNFGSKHVLNGLTFTLNRGKVLGILGPNGQGKTTLLNIISGLFKPSYGEITINGVIVSYETKKLVSYLQEKDFLSKWMKISDAICFYNDFFPDFDEQKCRTLLKFMNLETSMKLKTLSKGMLEKLGLSLTLSRKVQLYILDEPISGVDIISRDKIINVIIDNIDNNASMIITTHYVGELEKLFDEVIFLGEGSIIEQGTADDLRIKYETSIDQIYRKVFAE